MKIDAHQHFWEYDALRHMWINENMLTLRRNYIPQDLKMELEANGLDGSVAVQASQAESETEFLISLAKQNDSIKAIVGWVDLRSREVEDRLLYFTEASPKIKGFRHVIHDEADINFILDKNFLNGVSKLSKFGLTYDILIFPIHLKTTIEFIKKFPDQKFVIDHIAKPNIEKAEISLWKSYMHTLGKFDNVWCKLSGMVTEAKWNVWKYEDFVPYLDVVFDSFGPERLMFGSDWPVCLLSGSYGEVKGIVDRYVSKFNSVEKNKIFGDNAIQFYGINDQL